MGTNVITAMKVNTSLYQRSVLGPNLRRVSSFTLSDASSECSQPYANTDSRISQNENVMDWYLVVGVDELRLS